ncbi:MAG: glycosyltransferase [Saprospiraceae bacterium]|uniref:Glycosyltransferase n=1 Tax=Candidatus Opimibacter skivensis TaxID=2982028 RepID=A0A9D7SY77_9BACT|nr:glycosyltransferase [Candidatus Opimibacter skivensis]
MIEIIQLIWLLCLLIISIYHLVVFRVDHKTAPTKSISIYPGVSIVIAVKNGTDQLIKNLDTILHQEYPVFEIILVDDHSDLTERKNLEAFISSWPHIKLFTSSGIGKKQALKMGIENAQYEFILYTDADCTPATNQWIKTMIDHNSNNGVVLGYSPYLKLPGFLNQLIRFETVMTGIHYLSWAMRGSPYMAVGRNSLYPRSLLLSSDPFRRHAEIPYGDDDLGLQAMLGHTSVETCLDKASHVITTPATSWTDWFKQKHRHLSAGHYYKTNLWWQPGMYGLALIGHWFLFPLMMNMSIWRGWLILSVIGLLIRWQNYDQWTKKLGDKDTIVVYPVLEIAYAIYLALIGAFTVISKKKTWN